MNRQHEWCETCGRHIHPCQGVPVCVDPGDASSPPDGSWLCGPCAEAAEERDRAAEEAAIAAEYEAWAGEQYARHGWRGDV